LDWKFIEVTTVALTAGGASPGGKLTIGVSHIAKIAHGSSNTSVVTLANGERINVLEAYDDLKQMLGGRDAEGP
jgi:hypothetical protein